MKSEVVRALEFEYVVRAYFFSFSSNPPPSIRGLLARRIIDSHLKAYVI